MAQEMGAGFPRATFTTTPETSRQQRAADVLVYCNLRCVFASIWGGFSLARSCGAQFRRSTTSNSIPVHTSPVVPALGAGNAIDKVVSKRTGTHAIMICPNKALALDQRDLLIRLTEQMGEPQIESWWYDGDVDSETRRVIRDNPPNILITNPDMLHNSFLSHAQIWSQFYRGLTWVILDEMHEYRGYFGSNVALILRRFSHHLASLGVRPQFFLSSATCANAQEHAENLTGRTIRRGRCDQWDASVSAF